MKTPTRRIHITMSERGLRNLERVASKADMDRGAVLSFMFEHFSSVVNEDHFEHRLRLYRAAKAGGKS